MEKLASPTFVHNPNGKIDLATESYPLPDGPASRLVGDAWIARQLCMKPSTLRVQRHLRKKRAPHWFNLDPVWVGSSPRYARADVDAWLDLKVSNSHKDGDAPSPNSVASNNRMVGNRKGA